MQNLRHASCLVLKCSHENKAHLVLNKVSFSDSSSENLVLFTIVFLHTLQLASKRHPFLFKLRTSCSCDEPSNNLSSCALTCVQLAVLGFFVFFFVSLFFLNFSSLVPPLPTRYDTQIPFL